MPRAFWPGFQWRILAHEAKNRTRTGKSFDMRVGDRWLKEGKFPSGYPGLRLDGAWEFDEIVIDDWFHLEQMDERHWWLGVGNGDNYWHVNISINGKGEAQVRMEKQ
jgi:hypothetical protein